jgi:hypothetical protein
MYHYPFLMQLGSKGYFLQGTGVRLILPGTFGNQQQGLALGKGQLAGQWQQVGPLEIRRKARSEAKTGAATYWAVALGRKP